ncbi:MAG: L-arabinose isomerase [bacterium]|nr:MAG: L-arabinose isomerase [bacterium]
MKTLREFEAWFVTGSQHLYGMEVLKKVEEHSMEIAKVFDTSSIIPVKIVFKPVVKTPEEVYQVCLAANSTPNCIGIITWMHTFSPAKMWISGLKTLNKPILHLHTQFNQDIPFSEIDMDFMNLNQSAHGGREYGFMVSRMRIERKVVAGHWKDPEVQAQIGAWTRVAAGWQDAQNVKIARIGDNMREVAVTEGDKVEAQLKFGWSVNTYGLEDVLQHVNAATETEVDALVAEYESQYQMDVSCHKGGANYTSVREAARIEIGLRSFLEGGGFSGFTDTFENLGSLIQLPGIAVQRLMKDGYGFGAEGDWKTAALLRAMKVMALGLPGGNSFMEDYTYHFDPTGMFELGAHMLEICESIANGKPSLEVHPLGIGGKADPARLCFDVASGPAMNVSLVDMGGRFRLIVNEVDVIKPIKMEKLPVARTLWVPQPNLKIASTAWIYAGGAHHTCFSQNITSEDMVDFAEMAGIEVVIIGNETKLHEFKKELRWNDMYYHLAKGL